MSNQNQSESEFFFGKTSERMIDRRRLKIIRASPMLIIDVLRWCNNPDTYATVGLPVTTSLPADCEIVSVFCDWRDRSLEIMVYHELFDVVPDGQRVPILGDYLSRERLLRRVENPKYILEEC